MAFSVTGWFNICADFGVVLIYFDAEACFHYVSTSCDLGFIKRGRILKVLFIQLEREVLDRVVLPPSALF